MPLFSSPPSYFSSFHDTSTGPSSTSPPSSIHAGRPPSRIETLSCPNADVSLLWDWSSSPLKVNSPRGDANVPTVSYSTTWVKGVMPSLPGCQLHQRRKEGKVARMISRRTHPQRSGKSQRSAACARDRTGWSWDQDRPPCRGRGDAPRECVVPAGTRHWHCGENWACAMTRLRRRGPDAVSMTQWGGSRLHGRRV